MKLLDKSWKDGDLLIFNEKEGKQIRASMGKGMTDIQKIHDVCAYQFEMGYDLALSPGCNVSRVSFRVGVGKIWWKVDEIGAEIAVPKSNHIEFNTNKPNNDFHIQIKQLIVVS